MALKNINFDFPVFNGRSVNWRQQVSQQIEITVSPTGETQIETHGFSGSKCLEATKALEAALGQKLTETLTSEYHSCSEEQTNQTERHEPTR
jgi:hypothetical protein